MSESTTTVGNEAFGWADPSLPIDVTLGFSGVKIVFEKATLVDVTDDTLTFDATINGKRQRISVDHPYDPNRAPYRADITFTGDSIRTRELPMPAE